MDDPYPTHNLFLEISSYTNYETGGLFLILIILLVLVSITSGSEVAFMSITAKDMADNSEKFSDKIEKIQNIRKNPQQFLSNVLIFSNLINIGIVLISASISDIFSQMYHLSNTWKIIIDLVGITFIILMFGELIPKIYARKNAFRFSVKTIEFINIINFICYPLSKLLLFISNWIEKKIKKEDKIGVENLAQVLEIASEDSTTTKTEQKILESIVSFGNTQTRQIMTPRVDVFAINKTTDFHKVITLIHEKGYSRVPIYDENLDNICGILYAKDLIVHLDDENFDWNKLLKKPYFVPENKKSDDLLSDFKEKKNHMAIVVDEYGGTSGIVTLEDVMEEILGDISDEFDEDELTYSKIDSDNYVFDGKISLKDFFRVMDIDENDFSEQETEADTLAGLVLELAEEFPVRMQKIKFKNFIFQVESLDKKRLKRIKVSRIENNENKE